MYHYATWPTPRRALTAFGATGTLAAVSVVESGTFDPPPAAREAILMLAEYAGVVAILVMAVGLIVLLFAIHLRLRPSRVFAAKQDGYDAGEFRSGASPRELAPKFHRAMIPASLFAAAAFWLHPWGAVFRDLGWWGFVAIGVAMVPLAVAALYLRMKGGFEW
jgi:NADH-quinone oxidoreductase subunit A